MNEEIKRQPEETDVPLPEKELEQAAGGVELEPFHIQKQFDKSSPALYIAPPTTPAK
jgi:hypothetical protein